jgi:hypothetical protein
MLEQVTAASAIMLVAAGFGGSGCWVLLEFGVKTTLG